MYEAIKEVVGRKFCKVQPQGPNIVIEVDQKETSEKLLQVTELKSVPVNIKPHFSMNTCKGKVFCDNISDMTNEEIKEELQDQDVVDVYRTKKRDEDKLVPTNCYIVTFERTTLPDEVKIGYMNCKVYLYIPNPRQCFKCTKFGHGKNTCTHDPVCAKCAQAGPGHPEFKDCTNAPKCAHCHGDHPASSKLCPMYQLEKKITERKIKQNLSYPRARDQIYNEEPELVNKVPTLKVKKTTKTYSSVTATSSNVDQYYQKLLVQQQQQMSQMQQQILELTTLLKSQIYPANVMTSTSKLVQNRPNDRSRTAEKRSRSVGSVSSDETVPPKMQPSSRQEVKQAANSMEVLETPSSGNATPEDVVEDRARSRRPLNSKTPSDPPGRNVKGGGKTSSSQSSDGKGGVSSKLKQKPNVITAPNKPFR